MEIKNQNINFTSRAKIIRDTEKVCRIISSEFPAVSSTKVSEFDCAQDNPKFQEFSKMLFSKLKVLVRDPLFKVYKKGFETDYYLKLVNCVKEHKLANCSDFSKLCSLICGINGIETQKAQMVLKNQNNVCAGFIDHAINVLSIKDKPIGLKPLSKLHDVLIIDPWLGVVDLAPNMEIKFKSELSKFFKIDEGLKIVLNPYSGDNPKVTKDVIDFFRKNFPQLVINKGKV